MRSATVFIVFGLLLVGLFLFTKLNQQSTAKDPAYQSVSAFMAAIAENDAAKVQAQLDMTTVKPLVVAKKITSLYFKEMNAFEGAFSQAPSVLWSYADLADQTLDTKQEPMIDRDGGIAAFPCTSGAKIYLHLVDKSWKVYYITKPKAE